jgi:hypothetical protein
MTILRFPATVRTERPPVCGDDSDSFIVGGSILSGGDIGMGVISIVQEVGS